MKTFTRLFSLLLALTLAFSLGLPAAATEAPTTGSIVIEDAANVPVAGKTFKAYQVLEASFVDPQDPAKGVTYTVPAAMADFYAKRYSLDKSAPGFDEQVAGKIAEKEEADMFAFAAAVLAAAKQAGVVPGTATAEDHAKSVTISGLPFGYYVIEDAGAAAPISALMLKTLGSVTIKIKADRPVIDKKIDGSTDTDPETKGLVESNSTSIGDKVPYVLTSKVPDMTGYKKYFYVVSDTLSKGLTFNNDVVITLGGKTLKVNDDYTLTSRVLSSGETALEIVFRDFVKQTPGQTITIRYSATVDTDAVIGTAGNPNKVNLVYSNNPNVTAAGTPDNPDKPGPDDVTGKTPDEITRTFVTRLDITKVNSQQQTLAGAKFKLEGDRLNTVLVTGDRYVKSEGGTWYKLKDGSFTTTVPGEATNDRYESTTQKYEKKSGTTTVTKTDHVVYEGFTDAQGKLTFTGLGAGTYTLTELVAPGGYNMLKEPITVTITCRLPGSAATGRCVWGVSEDSVAAAAEDGNSIALTVENTTGTELPSTGGIGTTVFYIIGAGLMLAAAVLLITRKRMAQ